MRRLIMLVVALLVGVLFASGVALALTEIGAPGNDVLKGTNGPDRLDGRLVTTPFWASGATTLVSSAASGTTL